MKTKPHVVKKVEEAPRPGPRNLAAEEDPEERICYALSQIKMLDILFSCMANSKGIDFNPDELGGAGMQITETILGIFEDLDVVQLVCNDRADKMKERP